VEGVCRNADDSRLELDTPPIDRVIAALAERQHGVISATQLASLGVAQRAVSHRVAAGRLHRLHRGVYAVGHTVLGARGRWMAAVLACRPDAVLSHASAAALWDLRASAARLIDVTVLGTTGRKRPGLRIHRSRDLRPDEVTIHHGIPTTTPARTLLDLAAILQRRPLEKALDQAEIRELTDYPALDALARAHPGHHGAGRLRRALQTHHADTTVTKSELEERFLALCRRAGLPNPRVNAWVAGLEVDFAFEAAGVVVETDGWDVHRTRDAFERDRARDAALTRAGYRTLRFTHRQLANDPHQVAATLRVALADRAPAPRSSA
jgi:very-short-patch-repair endonuclease/predicted transcriptional regulator of viral defense system